jgi:hypothetical protein
VVGVADQDEVHAPTHQKTLRVVTEPATGRGIERGLDVPDPRTPEAVEARGSRGVVRGIARQGELTEVEQSDRPELIIDQDVRRRHITVDQSALRLLDLGQQPTHVVDLGVEVVDNAAELVAEPLGPAVQEAEQGFGPGGAVGTDRVGLVQHGQLVQRGRGSSSASATRTSITQSLDRSQSGVPNGGATSCRAVPGSSGSTVTHHRPERCISTNRGV